MNSHGDIDVPATHDAVNEVQIIGEYTDDDVDGGTFTLTFNLKDLEPFTTAAIAFGASAATIKTAINVAATSAAVPSWTNNDIGVTGGDLTSADVTLTFSGDSVSAAHHSQTTIDGSALTFESNPIIDGIVGEVTTDQEGGISDDEVQSIAVYANTVTGGTFTLTIDLSAESPFTTDPIAYGANAATIESAIDAAATDAEVGGWTNGDISVTGGPLTTDSVVLTFDGTSVTNQDHALTVIDGSSLTADSVAGEVTTDTDGQTIRSAWAALEMLGIVSGDLPVQGDDPSDIAVERTRGNYPFGLEEDTVRALVDEAAHHDNNLNIKTTLLNLLGY
jgi:hypothetical protein